MTHALRLPHTVAASVKSLLLASGLSLFAPFALPVDGPIDAGIFGKHEALGIGDEFGRFDGTIRLVYDPDGAPPSYDESKVQTLLEEINGAQATRVELIFQPELGVRGSTGSGPLVNR